MHVTKKLVSQGLKIEDFSTGTKILSSNRVVMLKQVCMDIIRKRMAKNKERLEYVKLMILDKNSGYWYPYRNFIFTDLLFQNKNGMSITSNLFTGFFNNKFKKKVEAWIRKLKRTTQILISTSCHMLIDTRIFQSLLIVDGNLKKLWIGAGYKDTKTILEIYQ